ncbi:MAG: hypothetical protein AAGA68_16905 [Pseudomonadota bacterium]
MNWERITFGWIPPGDLLGRLSYYKTGGHTTEKVPLFFGHGPERIVVPTVFSDAERVASLDYGSTRSGYRTAAGSMPARQGDPDRLVTVGRVWIPDQRFLANFDGETLEELIASVDRPESLIPVDFRFESELTPTPSGSVVVKQWCSYQFGGAKKDTLGEVQLTAPYSRSAGSALRVYSQAENLADHEDVRVRRVAEMIVAAPEPTAGKYLHRHPAGPRWKEEMQSDTEAYERQYNQLVATIKAAARLDPTYLEAHPDDSVREFAALISPSAITFRIESSALHGLLLSDGERLPGWEGREVVLSGESAVDNPASVQTSETSVLLSTKEGKIQLAEFSLAYYKRK